jgi:osmotically-inducible protein OsmY
VTVEVSGSRITLKGTVRSFAEKEDAEVAAWKAPGVSDVQNQIEIEIPEYAYQD